MSGNWIVGNWIADRMDRIKGIGAVGSAIVVAAALTLPLGMPVQAANTDDVLHVRARAGKDISTMDPAYYIGNEEYNIDLAIYSKLVKYKPGSSELVLDAAESLEISEDGTVISFTLKEGIQFHHGYGEMTAEDVKFSFERIIDPEVNSPYAPDWATLERVEVTGRYSGKIILEEPFAPLMTSTLPWTPGSIISKKAYQELGGRFATRPVGSGPYYWKEWQPNRQIVLQRFERYYGEKPDFARIVIHPIGEARIAELAFDRGELDVTAVSLDSIERYRNAPDPTVQLLPTLRYHWVGFNLQHAPFDDIRVRKAVRYAIDVETILAGAYNNVAERANAMIPPGILGHWEDAPQYEVDRERARRLLAEAGYPNGFETMITTDSTPEHLKGATIVQQQLERVGIEAEINIVQQMYSGIGENSVPGLHYSSFSATLDPGYWFNWFTCEQVGKWNYWKWCNEEFDRLHEKAAVTMDRGKRAQLYVRMQKIIDEDVSAVWITNGATVQVSKPGVKPVFLGMYSQYEYFEKVGENEE